MGCQSEVEIGDNLTFSVCTHDPDTGELTDADAVPSYRIYEDETAVAILTGNMAKLDDANTTGFYTELIACTTANGFEADKSYTIYIEATVDGDTGGIAYGFRVTTIAAVCACVTGWFAKSISVISTLVVGEIVITRGDTLILQFEDIGDITLRDNIWFTVKGDKDNVDSAADIQVDEDNGLLYINGVDAQAAGWAADGSITVTDAVAGDLTVRVEAVQTAKITVCSRNWYDLQVSWADGTVSTVSKGIARIIGDLTRATS